jgi:hypothetical protein
MNDRLTPRERRYDRRGAARRGFLKALRTDLHNMTGNYPGGVARLDRRAQ